MSRKTRRSPQLIKPFKSRALSVDALTIYLSARNMATNKIGTHSNAVNICLAQTRQGDVVVVVPMEVVAEAAVLTALAVMFPVQDGERLDARNPQVTTTNSVVYDVSLPGSQMSHGLSWRETLSQ